MSDSKTHFEQVPLEKIKVINKVQWPSPPKGEPKPAGGPATTQTPKNHPSTLSSATQKSGYAVSPIDIFLTEADGCVLWRGEAGSIEAAKARILEFSIDSPGDYLILNRLSGTRLLIRSGATVAAPEPQ